MPAIRLLTPDEAPLYRALRVEALADSPDAFGTTLSEARSRPLAFYEARLRQAPVFAAEAAGALVGMACLMPMEGARERHKASLTGFYVAPAWRGQGLGAALIDAVLAAAVPPVEQVLLSVVAENAAAIALYTKKGFVAYGREPRALKRPEGYADELLMLRRLTP